MRGTEIIKATGGKALEGNLDSEIQGFSIDTRTLKPGQWFVPLKGERIDGEELVEEALNKGAVGTFTTQEVVPEKNRDALIVKVDDNLKALQNVALYNRLKHQPVVIGVTGSSGKTTTKDLIASVLSQRYRVLKTEGNLNTEIGLPLMLLRITEEHDIVVLEMAMRGKGQIAFLADLALPQWGVITNIGEAHIEMLGSLEEIARAKGELIEKLPGEGAAFLFGDDPRLIKQGKEFSGSTYFFGEKAGNHFRLESCCFTWQGTFFRANFFGESLLQDFFLPVPGRHHAVNALAALGIGYMQGITENSQLSKGLEQSEVTGGRMEVKAGTVPGTRVIDDSYNANPASVNSALEVLAQLSASGRGIAVLGDMLELGEWSEEAHRRAGRVAVELGISRVIGVGKWSRYTAEEVQAKGVHAYTADNPEKAYEILQEFQLRAGDTILVKGSRGVGLDKLVEWMVC